MGRQLARLLSDEALRELAGERSYERGLAYFADGRVESIEDRGGVIVAKVAGTDDYRVTFEIEDGELVFTCDCPVGGEGAFCKHCVAASLQWRRGAGRAAKKKGQAKEPTLEDAKRILLAEDLETVVRMVAEWARDDDRLYERLILLAARRMDPGSGAAAVWKAFEKAVRVRGGYVDYRAASGWAQNVDDAIDQIGELVKEGHAAEAVALCEKALTALGEEIESVDDSDGRFLALQQRLEEIHFRACEAARPDPVQLAQRLFRMELTSDFDAFDGAVVQYAKILGAEGLKAYRKAAEAEWKKVPAGTQKPKAGESGRSFRITTIMESLARASGDVDELVAVMSRDLSSGYQYLRIAETLGQAGRRNEALTWAEKGMRVFPDRVDSRLREFAATEYQRRGEPAKAMEQAWAVFAERPVVETYAALEKHGRKAKVWPDWREKALNEVRARIAKAKKEPSRRQYQWALPHRDHSELVELFLYEEDGEAAWKEALDGGCRDSLWLKLASMRERDKPEDAAPVFLRLAVDLIGRTSNGRYEEGVGLLEKAAALMKRLGRSAEFVMRLEQLRAQYKIKRNFIKLVDQRRRALYLA